MATDKETLRKACRVLEAEIEKNKEELDQDKDSFEEHEDTFQRFHINNKRPTATAIESLKYQLSMMQGSVRAMETIYNCMIPILEKLGENHSIFGQCPQRSRIF